MGHSQSSIVQQIVNKTLNESISSSLTSNSQETSVETLVNSSKSCSSSVNQSNSCNMSKMKVAGDFTLGGTMTNKASVDFSCINSTTAASAMENAAVASIANELGSLNGTEAAAVLNAAAESSNKSGFASSGGSSSSNVNANTTNEVTNLTKSTIENIFKSHISQTLNSKTVDECIGRTVQNNTIEAVGTVVGGNAKIECNASNSLEQVQECKQLTEAITTALGKTAQELGFKMETTSSTKSKTEMKSSAKSENVSTGPIQDIGNAVSGIINSIGNIFGLASLGMAAPFVIICCCVCCCVLISCASSLVAAKSGGGSGSSGNFNIPKGLGHKNFKGGYSENENSDSVEYLGLLGINVMSEILSDSSPLFD
jgi:hypothetical protein